MRITCDNGSNFTRESHVIYMLFGHVVFRTGKLRMTNLSHTICDLQYRVIADEAKFSMACKFATN